MPEISIIIPACGRTAYLGDAVESALRQTYRDREVIVIDDGAAEDLPDRIARFGDRIRVIRAEAGEGASPWARGVAEARGEWVALLDPRDIWIDMKTEHQIDLVRRRPEFGWIASCSWDLEGGREVRCPRKGRSGDVQRRIRKGSFLRTSTVMIRKDWFDRAGPLAAGLHPDEDAGFWSRLAGAGPLGYIPRPLALCRRPHPGGREEGRGDGLSTGIRCGDADRVRGIVGAYRAALEGGGLRILREGHRSRVVRIGEGDGEVIVKHYRPGGLRDALRALIGGSRAARAWRQGLALEKEGIGVPPILGVVERTRGGLPCDSLLIMDPIPDSLEMDRAICRHRARGAPLDGIRRMILAFARSVRKMHEAGFYHADLKSCNVLVRGPDPNWKFTFLDLEDVRDRGWLPLRFRLENLAQLNATVPAWIGTSDRLRFFLAVLEEKRLDARGKGLFRKVLARSREKDRVFYDDGGVVREEWPVSG